MKWVFRLFLFAFWSGNFTSASSQVNGIFSFDGLDREYILYVPESTNDPMPLVFNLHGYTSNATQQMLYSEMNSVADTYGFAVCYPQGTNDDLDFPHWNSALEGDLVDDLGFLSALAQFLQEDQGFDPERTFACGMSNGGFMSYLLGCQAPDVFKAVASVAGTMNQSMLDECSPNPVVPLFAIHGTLDPVVPYEGSELLPEEWGSALPIEDVVNYWVNLNGCGAPEVVAMQNINLLDLCTVMTFKYLDCDSGNEQWFYKVEGGGHTWPGAFPTVVVGVTNQDFDASEEIWIFFDQVESPSTAIDERSISPTIYPNPITDQINVQSSQQFDFGELLDMTGKSVEQWQLPPSLSFQLDCNNLPAGFYFLVLKKGETRTISKIVIE